MSLSIGSPSRIPIRVLWALVLLALPPWTWADDALPPPGAEPALIPPGVELLRLNEARDYPHWRKWMDWRDLRPFSDSADRFRLRRGVLRLESEGDSFLIGSTVWGVLPRELERYPFLRFVVRIDEVPAGSDLEDERIDDSALRIMTVFRKKPPRSIVYAWTWALPAGVWSARSRSLLGNFREVRRKSFGQGRPPAGQWLTVEVNLLADYRTQFPGGAPPTLRGIALKTDSNDVDDGRSLAWLRSISLHAHSLRDHGLKEWDALGDTVVWYR